MKVAIIGAGLAGLSCAHELEKHGLSPVIYERNSFIGEQYSHITATLEIINRPIDNIVEFYKNQFGINLNPLRTIKKIIHNSPNNSTSIKKSSGGFGYFFKRTKESDSVKGQLFYQLKNTEVRFNSVADYLVLAKEFDNVVIANGEPNFTKELGCWQHWLHAYVRGGTVLGNFDPETLIVWINKEYCKDGYAYLTPFNENKASIVLIATNINEHEIDEYWKTFLYREDIKYPFLEEFKLEHFAGYVYPHKVGNILLAGNAGGSITPFLGFGQVNSIVHGVMAARSIALGQDYEELISPVVKEGVELSQFRKAYNKITNNEYDLLVSSIGLPGLKQLVYDTNFNLRKYGGKY